MPPKAIERARLDCAKRFQAYRGEPVQTDQQIIASLANTNYINPAAVPAGPALAAGLPARPRRKAPQALSAAVQLVITNFLAMANNVSPIPDATWVEYGGGPANWRGVKLLGQGGNGIVGLWEYRHTNLAQGQSFRQVVIKECTSIDPYNSNLDWDDEYHQKLRLAGSPHINHSLKNGVPVVNAAAENIPLAWNGRIKRLLMEYCPLGDLQGLINTFQRMARSMREMTVWRIFDCLVDGLCVLEFGNELLLKAPGDTFESVLRTNCPGNWKPIIHFDLKPPNILLAEDKHLHATSPIADFGLAEYQEIFTRNAEDENWRRRSHQRGHGTEGFYAPEQFTGAWETKDYKTSGIAGEYYDTNAWGVGCIMYQVMLLSDTPPDPKTPAAPNFSAKYAGLPQNGRTYGNALRGGLAVNDSSLAYSKNLIDLVQWCLMEIPEDRPNIRELKRLVRGGIIAAAQASGVAGTDEEWGFFITAPLPLVGNKELCSMRFDNGIPCKNQARYRGYCQKHRGLAP